MLHIQNSPAACLQALTKSNEHGGRHPCLQVLSPRELDWVDSYHREVWEKVSPRLQDAKHAKILEWLKTNTQPLQRPAVAAGNSKEAVAA